MNISRLSLPVSLRPLRAALAASITLAPSLALAATGSLTNPEFVTQAGVDARLYGANDYHLDHAPLENDTYYYAIAEEGVDMSLSDSGHNLYVGYAPADAASANFCDVLTICNNGSLGNHSSYIGYPVSDAEIRSGAVIVTGPGSSWTTADDLNVGNSLAGSNASLSVLDGASVFSQNAYVHGAATVSGKHGEIQSLWHYGTGWMQIFDGGILKVESRARIIGGGYLTVHEGGVFNVNSGAHISSGEGHVSGAATVSGAGSMWSTGTEFLFVGASGELLIDDTGAVVSTGGNVSGTAIVTGVTSNWDNNGNLSVETGASFSIRDGALTSCVGSRIAGTARIAGSANGLTSHMYFGSDALLVDNGGSLTATGGGLVTGSAECRIGSESASSNNCAVLVENHGSLLACTSLILGFAGAPSSTGNTLTVADGALVTCSGTLTVNAGSARLSGGCLAIKSTGTLTDEAIKALGLQFHNGSSYVPFAGSNLDELKDAGLLRITYYDAANFIEGDEFFDTFQSYGVDLSGGYTLIRAGVRDLAWADVTGSDKGFHNSSWYGSFYLDTTFGNWIWHESQGWQYVCDLEGGAIVLWDCATASWWYTGRDYFPYVYDFGTGGWYYYCDGTCPERKFWSWNDGDFVTR
jgi:T5SS/PEP-CTERM-associated repeat protein